MIYLKAFLLFHQEALPLASPHNNLNITTCHTSLNQKIKTHGIMNFQQEIGQVFGSSALAEKNQYQYAKF